MRLPVGFKEKSNHVKVLLYNSNTDKDIHRMFSIWLQFQTKPPPKRQNLCEQ